MLKHRLFVALFYVVVALKITVFYGRAVPLFKIILSWPLPKVRNSGIKHMVDKTITLTEKELQRLIERYTREIISTTLPQVVEHTLYSMGIDPRNEQKLAMQADMLFLRAWRRRMDKIIDVATGTLVTWIVRATLVALVGGVLYFLMQH